MAILRQGVHMAQTQAHTIDGILLTKFDTIDDKARSLFSCIACIPLKHAAVQIEKQGIWFAAI